ncbi:copper amine oxidase N-terminal domain-containing protein [uncultured Brevibacillus sp.]|uniref:copper amine oxidase N-terminal domain-containing protein n=1 Tax=uncultured Brevibacillus sp. TaxID=169970 RepID=UPI0025989E82|nr:copper amine oxidase N-terminal domain-containing protein [uncultured Brevibacillus sp.]
MFKKQYLAIASALVLTVGLFPTSSSASVATKNLQAKYNNIKVLYNGAAVPTTVEPFIVNGTTYIPLRMMAGVFNKDITWDGTTYTINVKDQADSQHAAELAARDAQIRTLQSKIDSLNKEIADLEDDLDKKKNNDDDDFDDRLSDLEKQLNKDYDDFRDLDWEITLDGDEDEIEVEIEIDLDEYQDEFDDLDDDDFEELVEDIVSDIWDEFDDADVTGKIIDSDTGKKKYSFEGDVDDEDIYFDGSLIK